MNSYFSNNAVMCDPSGTILGNRTHIAISLLSFPSKRPFQVRQNVLLLHHFYCNVLQVL